MKYRIMILSLLLNLCITAMTPSGGKKFLPIPSLFGQLTSQELDELPKNDNAQNIEVDVSEFFESRDYKWNYDKVSKKYKEDLNIFIARIRAVLEKDKVADEELEVLFHAFKKLVVQGILIQQFEYFSENKHFNNAFTIPNPLAHLKKINLQENFDRAFKEAQELATFGVHILEMIVPAMYNEILVKNKMEITDEYFDECIRFIQAILNAQIVSETGKISVIALPKSIGNLITKINEKYKRYFDEATQENIKQNYFDIIKACEIVKNVQNIVNKTIKDIPSLLYSSFSRYEITRHLKQLSHDLMALNLLITKG